jgi:hypothetical protein
MEEETTILQAHSEINSFEKFSPEKGEKNGDNKAAVEPLFDNLVWMTSAEAARYLRKSVGALRVMVCRRQIRARKFHRPLYFRRFELDRLLETSELKGGI